MLINGSQYRRSFLSSRINQPEKVSSKTPFVQICSPDTETSQKAESNVLTALSFVTAEVVIILQTRNANQL